MANASYKRLFLVAALLFSGAALTGVLFSFIGPTLADVMLPAVKKTVAAMHRDYTIHELKIDRAIHPERVVFTAVKDTPGGGMVFMNTIRGLPFSGYFTVNSGYMLPMISFALLFAWPYLPLRRKLVAIPPMVVILAVFWFVYVVLCVIGGIETGSRRIIDVKGSHSIQKSVEAFGYSFVTTGGLQFLGIVAFLAAIAPLHFKRPRTRDAHSRPNEPCPCGSGRKYKRCCGK